MPEPLTETDRITVLEQAVQHLLDRVEALEVREAQREGREAGLTTSESDSLSQEIMGAVQGSKDANTLNQFE